jgi:hypothetical protein
MERISGSNALTADFATEMSSSEDRAADLPSVGSVNTSETIVLNASLSILLSSDQISVS